VGRHPEVEPQTKGEIWDYYTNGERGYFVGSEGISLSLVARSARGGGLRGILNRSWSKLRVEGEAARRAVEKCVGKP